MQCYFFKLKTTFFINKISIFKVFAKTTRDPCVPTLENLPKFVTQNFSVCNFCNYSNCHYLDFTFCAFKMA